MTTTPNNRDRTAEWMKGLGTRFVNVNFIMPDGSVKTEEHVDDTSTLGDTILMSMQRLRCKIAWFHYGDEWAMLRHASLAEPGTLRRYPTEAAAEMAARHA